MDSAAVSSVLKQIDNVLDNHSIDEVGIIMGGDPMVVVHIETKLGISHLVMKPLFKFVVEKLYALDALMNGSCSDDNEDSGGGGGVVNYSLLKEKRYNESANSLSRMVLLIKGDFPLAFKLRKLLIETNLTTSTTIDCKSSNRNNTIESELELLTLIFGRTPKTPSGWYHRRWCLSRNMELKKRHRLIASEVEGERELCRKFAESSPKNYYCWMHRLWLLEYHMTDVQLVDEFYFTREWLVSHVSDHSACSHRIHVIYLLLKRLVCDDCSSEILELLIVNKNNDNDDDDSTITNIPPSNVLVRVFTFLFHCLDVSEFLITTRPGHEALWYHRRSLFVLVIHLVKVIVKMQWPTIDDSTLLTKESIATTSATVRNSLNPLHNEERSANNEQAILLIRDSLLSLLVTGSSALLLLNWLQSLLQCEVDLCRKYIVNKEDVWDYAMQRSLALRYSTFILDVAMCSVHRSHQVTDMKVLTITNTIQVHTSSDDDTLPCDASDVSLSIQAFYDQCSSNFSEISEIVRSTGIVFHS